MHAVSGTRSVCLNKVLREFKRGLAKPLRADPTVTVAILSQQCVRFAAKKGFTFCNSPLPVNYDIRELELNQ